MSKIALTGNASGSGTFTLAAPNSDTDRTLTLPDEAGTVLIRPASLSAWPAFRLSLTADQNETTSGVETDIVWDRTSGENCYIQGGMSLASGVITVPVDGIYLFNTTLRVDGVGSGYLIGYIVRNNDYTGSSETFIINGSPDGTYENLSGSSHFKMNAGDTVRASVYTSADTSWTVDERSTFSGSLIAAE